MSDTNKFINTYIDTVVSALHEQLGSGLQLKTQLKLANDIIQEKDGIIVHLSNEIENIRNMQGNVDSVQAELIACQDRLRIAEESHNALKVKVSHMDTMTRQIGEMKQEIKIRDDKIAELTENLGTKETQTSSLNKTIVEKESELTRLKTLLKEKEDEAFKLNAKLDKTKPTNDKVSKESSTVKVQLNTKSKPKELPIDDDF